MSQPATLVNSLAKVFDSNTVRNQGTPASAIKPVGSPSNPPTPDGLQSMDLKLDGLAEKVDLLVSAQGRLLQSLEGAWEKSGGLDRGDGPILCPDKPWRAEVSEVLAILRRETEKQSRRMEAMEKLMRAVEKVTGFLGETFRNSRIVQFLLTGRVGAKVKGEPGSSGKHGLDLPEPPTAPVGSEARTELQDKGEENTGQEHRDRAESPQDPDGHEHQGALPPLASPTGQAEEREDTPRYTPGREKERITITVEVDPNGSHIPSEAEAEGTANCTLTLQSQRAATTGHQLGVADAEPIREALAKTLAAVAETVKEIRRGNGRPVGETGERPSGVGGTGTDLPLAGGSGPIDGSAGGKSPIAGKIGSSGTGMGKEASVAGKVKSSGIGMEKKPSIAGTIGSSGTGIGKEPSIAGKIGSSGTGMVKEPSIAGKIGSSGTRMGTESSIAGKIGPSGTVMGKEPSIAGTIGSSGTVIGKEPSIAGKIGSSGTVMGKEPSIAGKIGSSGTVIGKEPSIAGKIGSSGTGMGKEPSIAGKIGSSGTGMGKKPSIAGKIGSSGTGMGKEPSIAGEIGSSGTGMGTEASVTGKVESSGIGMEKKTSITGKIGSSGTGLDGKSSLTNRTDPSDCSPTQQLPASANTGSVSQEAWAASEVLAGPGGNQSPGARAESLASLGGPASEAQGKPGTEPLTEGVTARAGGPSGAGGSGTPQGPTEDPNESVRTEGRPGEIRTGDHESGEQPSQPEEHPEQSHPIVDDSPPPPAPFEYRIVSAKHFIVTSLYAIDYTNLLGGGRFGQVYRCQERSTGLDLAAKIIKTKGLKDKNEVKNEINVMNHLNHVNLIQLYDAYEARNNITLIMECVEGGELFDRILERDGKMTELDAALVTRQICEGIQYMHGNYVLHLDLKPENILCVNQSSNQIKIIDFGLARRYKPREKLKINFGTPEFISPEVINYDFVSFPTDMWGVGVIVYMMVSGFSPFLGDDDTETMNNVIHCKWTFDDECFHGISDEAKEFIEGLLIRERSGRMTASECRKHPWLEGAECRAQMLQVQLKSQVARRSLARRRWKRSQYAVIAANRFRALAGLGRPAQAP